MLNLHHALKTFLGDGFTLFFFCRPFDIFFRPQVYLKKSEVFQTGTRHEGLEENIPTMGAAVGGVFSGGFFRVPNCLDLQKVLVTKSIG